MPLQLSENAVRKLLIALGIYITSLIAANTLGLKIMPFLFDSHLSVGVFMFPVVFLMTDVIGELYGKKVAKYFVLAGAVSSTLWIAYSAISLLAPWAADSYLPQDSYNDIFGLTIRVAIASVLAYAIAEYQDVLSFFFFKAKFGDRHFVLRSTLSNIWSQFLDTVIFMTVAFAGIYDTELLLSLIITWWLYKVAMGFLYTPLSYLALKLLKDKNNAGTTA